MRLQFFCGSFLCFEDFPVAERRKVDYLANRVHQLEGELRGRKLKEKHLQRELQKHRSLYGVSSSLSRTGKLAELIQLIAAEAVKFFAAHGSCLALFDDAPGGGLEVCGCSGELTGRAIGLRFQSNVLGQFSGTLEGRIFPNCRAEKEIDPIVLQICRTSSVLSAMATPVQAEGKTLGLLYLFSRTQSFARSDLDWLGLLTDLAADEIHRRRTEQSLKESEERFRFMAETTGDVIYRLKYDSMRYDYLSPGIIKLTGYSPDEIQSQGFARLVTRIDTPREKNVPAESIVRDRLEGRTGEYRADYLVRTRSQALRWVRDHSFPWYDEAGSVIGSVGILSDINDYKRAEARIEQRTEELIESEEKYRSLVENVPLVVYRMKPGAHVFFLNQFVEQVFGVSAGEILRNPELWAERICEEDRERVLRLRKRSGEEGREFVAEYRIVHKSGQLVHVLDHAVPFRSSDGTITSLDGIIMDMTGRVRLQEELVRAEGLKTIGEVSQRLAHEIRNPLVSAGGFARLLFASMDENDPNRHKVRIIVQEVARLESILRTIIKYLEPFELNTSLVDLDKLVKSLLEQMRGEIDLKQIRLGFHTLVPSTPVPADAALMEQALRALLKNAVEHVPEQGMLTVSTVPAAEAVRLSITYQVAHLAEDDVEHFFYPFTTSQTGYNDTDLPMSKIIVAKHGGQIDVRYQGSHEVVITVSLPVRSAN